MAVLLWNLKRKRKMNTVKLRVDISKTVIILFTDYMSVTSEFVKRQGLPGKYLKLVGSPSSPGNGLSQKPREKENKRISSMIRLLILNV